MSLGMDDRKWSPAGFSLLFLGIALGGLARTLHVSDHASEALSITSGLFSLSAIVLFVKGAAPGRRRRVVLTMVGLAASLAIATAVVVCSLHR